ncbi:MAG TPA: hypothetical protein VF746_02985 [Longimicrobium sp.]|jgi:hypothetical protein
MSLPLSSRRALLRGALAALGLLAACAGRVAGPGEPSRPPPDGTAPPGQVRPLDPLTAAERTAAVRLVTEDQRFRQIVAGRAFDVPYVELLAVKPIRTGAEDPLRPAAVGRVAEVLASVYERRFVGVRALVDLERGRVMEVTSFTPEEEREPREAGAPRFSVPFSDAEQALARDLALRDTQVRGLLRGDPADWVVEGLPISTRIPGVCPSGRCLDLIFRRGDTYLTSRVVVDIPNRTVLVRRARP